MVLNSLHHSICHHIVPCLPVLNKPLFIVLVSPISHWMNVKLIAKLPVALEVIPTLERIKLINVR